MFRPYLDNEFSVTTNVCKHKSVPHTMTPHKLILRHRFFNHFMISICVSQRFHVLVNYSVDYRSIGSAGFRTRKFQLFKRSAMCLPVLLPVRLSAKSFKKDKDGKIARR